MPSLVRENLPLDQICAAASKSGFVPARAGSSSARIAATSLPIAAFGPTSDAGAYDAGAEDAFAVAAGAAAFDP